MAVVHYEMPVPASTVTVRIFDVRGRLVRRLVNGEPAGTSGDYVWDGRDDGRGAARIGMYIVHFEAVDEVSGGVTTAKQVVVLARPL
jgi:flagellar hook assembly protein FlgD